MMEERQRHESDAAKMARKQAKIYEESIKKQEDAEKVGGGRRSRGCRCGLGEVDP